MSLHTGISLFLFFSSLIYGGITGYNSSITFISSVTAFLYMANIIADMLRSKKVDGLIISEIKSELQKLDTRIMQNRTNTEVIIKEIKAEVIETNTKMGEIRLSASSVKTQNGANAQKYRF